MGNFSSHLWANGDAWDGPAVNDLESRIDHAVARRVAVLPAAGDAWDGREVDLQTPAMEASGVMWRLRWSAAAGRWSYLGGAPLIAEVATLETRAPSAWGDMATVGPSIALPASGDYAVEWGAIAGSIASGGTMAVGVSVGGAMPPGVTEADDVVRASTASGARFTISRLRRKNGLTGGQVLKLVYLASGGSPPTDPGVAGARWLRVEPIQLAS